MVRVPIERLRQLLDMAGMLGSKDLQNALQELVHVRTSAQRDDLGRLPSEIRDLEPTIEFDHDGRDIWVKCPGARLSPEGAFAYAALVLEKADLADGVATLQRFSGTRRRQ